MMMESFLEDAENSLHHRVNTVQDGSDSCSTDSDDPLDDPFLYDKFLPDPDWAKAGKLEEEENKPRNLVDPGPFRYNKRVFVTSLPAMLLVLALGGETPVLIVAIGTGVITLMSQLGDSRRCVIAFILLFIPSHAYILASVVPLLWLSGWHFFLVLLVNVYMVLTGGWVMLQFKAFRMEEPGLASVIEMMLFTVYPLVCTGVFCWSLGAVLSVSLLPLIFSLIWFSLLQLYLVPTLSSFRTQSTPDESLDIVQIPIVVVTVLAFIGVGPFLHVIISLVAPDVPPVFSAISVIHLIFTVSSTLFLSTLLSIRQIFEYIGFPISTAIYVRWVSGIACTILCYPVLHTYGLDSHFLPLLPVAIAMFAALGVVLAFKKRRVIMLVLAVVLIISLVSLFLLWIQRMPHNLQHYFMGVFPINVFYLMICTNFLLCLICLWTASVDAKPLLGAMIILQSMVHTICELSLHNTQLYSTSLLQLTSLSACYTIHRLQIAEKISRKVAIISSAVHMAKSLGSLTSLVLNGAKGEVTVWDMMALTFMTMAIASVFLYGATGEKSAKDCTQQLLFLLVALAVNSHQFILPLSMIMFSGTVMYADIIGLWCLLGAGITLLYSQTISSQHTTQILKLALALAVMGVIVIVVHPQLNLSIYSVFQWLEIISVCSLAAMFACGPQMAPLTVVVLSVVMAICPGIRVCLYLWSEFSPVLSGLCVLDVWAVLMLTFVCVFISEMTEASDKVMKYSVALALCSCLCMLILDLFSYVMTKPSSQHLMIGPADLWSLPAWWAVLGTCVALAVVLKLVLTTKSPDKLPIMNSLEGGSVSLPLTANFVTILAFLVACTQGPSQPTLHDLWCCGFSIVFGCLHGDKLLLPRLDGERQATPTVMTSLAVLLIATIARSRLWAVSSFFTTLGGLVEVILALLTTPMFYVLFGILWWGKVTSEPAVIFLLPYTVLLLLLSTTYTGWILAVSALISGCWMMLYRLPMTPYVIDADGVYIYD